MPDSDSQTVGPVSLAVAYFVAGTHIVLSATILSVALTLVLGWSQPLAAELWLAMHLSIFAIPVAFFSDLMVFPWWAWLAIVLHWIGATMHYGRLMRSVEAVDDTADDGGDDENLALGPDELDELSDD